VFEQCHFLRFHNAVTVEERVFILEIYLKTMSYVHCGQSFLKNLEGILLVPWKEQMKERYEKLRGTW